MSEKGAKRQPVKLMALRKTPGQEDQKVGNHFYVRGPITGYDNKPKMMY